jgi:hypothetical protein
MGADEALSSTVPVTAMVWESAMDPKPRTKTTHPIAVGLLIFVYN